MAVNVPIVSEWKSAGLDRASRDLDKFGKDTEGRFRKLSDSSRKFGLAMAGLATSAVLVGKGLISAGENASTSNARIEQVATSMGLFGTEVGEVTNRLVKYAETTARATGIDQNQIKATQAKLLTFANLAATADEAGGAFDRATAAAIDLAAAGFGEAASNAVQLGKALQDPIKGISALGESGVTFTKTEQDLIKTLVESGKIADAQNMILGALETQVGGTAAATANASDQMRVAFTQLQERIGLKLLPVFTRFASFITDRLYPAIERFTRFAWQRLVDAFQSARPFLERVAAIFNDNIRPAIERVVEFMRNNEDVVKAFLGVLAGAAVLAALGRLAGLLGALASPIGIVVAALAALAGAFVYAYQNIEWFRDAADTIGRWFRDKFPVYFVTALDAIGKAWNATWDAMLAMGRWFQRTWLNEDSIWRQGLLIAWRMTFGAISTVVKGTFDIIKGLFDAFKNIFSGLWNLFLGVITGNWSRAWNGIVSIFTGFLGLLKVGFDTFALPFKAAWAAFGDYLRLVWDAVWKGITFIVGGALDAIGKLFTAARMVITTIWDNTIGRIISGVQQIVSGVQSAISAVQNLANMPIPNPLGAIGSIPGRIIGGIRGILPFADGGLVTRPTLGLVGEAGPEVVVPLDRLGGLGGNVNVYVQGSVVTEKDLVEQIRIGLIRAQRSGKQLIA